MKSSRTTCDNFSDMIIFDTMIAEDDKSKNEDFGTLRISASGASDRIQQIELSYLVIRFEQVMNLVFCVLLGM